MDNCQYLRHLLISLTWNAAQVRSLFPQLYTSLQDQHCSLYIT